MVDIRGKADTHRYALASGKVYLGQTAYELVRDNQLRKGDVLTVAQLAGVSHVAVLFGPEQSCSIRLHILCTLCLPVAGCAANGVSLKPCRSLRHCSS